MEEKNLRIIVFKAKKTDAKEWIEGFYCETASGNPCIHHADYGFTEVLKETVCQYTGMPAIWLAYENEAQECDVWEHDLLEVSYQGEHVIAEVIYDSGMFILASNKFTDSYIPLFDVVQTEDGCSYVDAVHRGNIFDNPELLKENDGLTQ